MPWDPASPARPPRSRAVSDPLCAPARVHSTPQGERCSAQAVLEHPREGSGAKADHSVLWGPRRERDMMTSVMQVLGPVRLFKTFQGPVRCCVSFWASKEDLGRGPCPHAASNQRVKGTVNAEQPRVAGAVCSAAADGPSSRRPGFLICKIWWSESLNEQSGGRR